MHELALTAIGRDRPGIVAGVTGVLFRLGCNLSDCSMTRLSGQFAMIMLIEAPDDVTAAFLEDSLASASSELGQTVTVTTASGTSEDDLDPRPYVISLYGSDHPGIVYKITTELAGQNVNIADLLSREAGGIYTVILEVELPPDLEAGALEARLRSIAAEVGVEVNLRTADPDAL